VDRKVDDKGFTKAWFSPYVGKAERTAGDALSEVRDFAYSAFDRLDKNKNGFLEISELEAALKTGSLSEREQSFIMFLLNNHEAIAESFDESAIGSPAAKTAGISRQDLDAYFKLVLSLL
jgi:hypothetical protein